MILIAVLYFFWVGGAWGRGGGNPFYLNLQWILSLHNSLLYMSFISLLAICINNSFTFLGILKTMMEVFLWNVKLIQSFRILIYQP